VTGIRCSRGIDARWTSPNPKCEPGRARAGPPGARSGQSGGSRSTSTLTSATKSTQPSGTVLYNHVIAYYAWLDEPARTYPNLSSRTARAAACASTLGIIAHTNTPGCPDQVLRSRACSRLPMHDRVCASGLQSLDWWATRTTAKVSVESARLVGLPVPRADERQFGISAASSTGVRRSGSGRPRTSRCTKRLRTEMLRADVYHLTLIARSRPARRRMALEYAAPERDRAIVMTYRLGQSAETEY